MSKHNNKVTKLPAFTAYTTEELLRLDRRVQDRRNSVMLDKLCAASLGEVSEAKAYFTKSANELDDLFKYQHKKSDRDWVTTLSCLTDVSAVRGATRNILVTKAEIESNINRLVEALKSGQKSKIDKIYADKYVSPAEREYRLPTMPLFNQDRDINKHYSKIYFHSLISTTIDNPFHSGPFATSREYSLWHLAAKVAKTDPRPLNDMLNYANDFLNNDQEMIKKYAADHDLVDQLRAVFNKRNGLEEVQSGKDEYKKGNTILHSLIKNGDVKSCKTVIDFMVKIGADFSICGVKEMPALHYAVSLGQNEIATYLIEQAHVSVEMLDSNCKKPIDIARSVKNSTMEKILDYRALEIASVTSSLSIDNSQKSSIDSGRDSPSIEEEIFEIQNLAAKLNIVEAPEGPVEMRSAVSRLTEQTERELVVKKYLT